MYDEKIYMLYTAGISAAAHTEIARCLVAKEQYADWSAENRLLRI